MTAKLGKATGGIEHIPSALSSPSAPPPKQDPLAVTPASGYRSAIHAVKVERDADGKITKVLRRDNPLNDPLNDLEDDDDEPSHGETTAGAAGAAASAGVGAGAGAAGATKSNKETRVVDLLEQQANVPTEKHIRHQSAREREWLDQLVAKHGDDTGAMARDLKLNPMQQTASDIRRRLKAYRSEER